MSLHLKAGAVIKASTDLADYPVQPYFHNELGHLRALIVNPGYDNMSVTGSGTIGKRPAQCLFMRGAKNLTVSGIRVIDAPCWTLTFSECENVKLTGLTIDTDLNIPNDDGIHISACKGVIISDCHITSGDDCIALSCITNWDRPCEDIVITNCGLKS